MLLKTELKDCCLSRVVATFRDAENTDSSTRKSREEVLVRGHGELSARLFCHSALRECTATVLKADLMPPSVVAKSFSVSDLE